MDRLQHGRTQSMVCFSPRGARCVRRCDLMRQPLTDFIFTIWTLAIGHFWRVLRSPFLGTSLSSTTRVGNSIRDGSYLPIASSQNIADLCVLDRNINRHGAPSSSAL